MAILGAQSVWKTGSRFLFQRDAVNGIVQPILDLGTITVASPNFTPTPVQLEDSDGGFIRVIAEEVTKMDEVYEFKCSNLNMDNLSLAFMAQPPTIYDPGANQLGELEYGGTGQAATPVVNVPHIATPGRLVKIADMDAIPVFGLTSVDAIHLNTSGGTALALYNASSGTGDYQIYSLERGLIRILTGGLVTQQSTIFVNYTPRAITGNRTIYPQTQACTSTGLGILIWGRCNNAEQSVRVGRYSLTPTTNTFDVAKFSDIGLRARILCDPTLATNPAGHMSYWIGNMPALS